VQGPHRQPPEEPGVASSTDGNIFSSLTWHQPRLDLHSQRLPSDLYGTTDPHYLTPTYAAGGNHSSQVPVATQPPPYSSTSINLSSRPKAILPSSPPNPLDPANRVWPYLQRIMSDHDGNNDLEPPPTAQMHPIIDPAVTGDDPTSAPKSEEPSSPDGHEEFSPRRGFTHKRNEDPPRNDAGKMICRFQNTCGGLIFERRCEWRYAQIGTHRFLL